MQMVTSAKFSYLLLPARHVRPDLEHTSAVRALIPSLLPRSQNAMIQKETMKALRLCRLLLASATSVCTLMNATCGRDLCPATVAASGVYTSPDHLHKQASCCCYAVSYVVGLCLRCGSRRAVQQPAAPWLARRRRGDSAADRAPAAYPVALVDTADLASGRHTAGHLSCQPYRAVTPEPLAARTARRTGSDHHRADH